MTKPSIAAILQAFNEEISTGSIFLRTRQHADRVLVKVLHDMELNRPLYYFTMQGMVRGLNFMRTFYLGGSLMFGPTLPMGTFMALKGIILHSMARLIYEARGRISSIGFISGLPGITHFQPALSLIAVNQGSGEHISLPFYTLPGVGTGIRLGDLLHHPLL